MKGIDLSFFDFDYDLTFCALLMHADGTIYHTYGGRTWEAPESHLSDASLVRLLQETLAEHELYRQDPQPPPRRRKQAVEELPKWARREKKPDCYHCHMVGDGRYEQARERKRWSRDDIWIWPDPIQIGVTLDRDDQAAVRSVVADSPAAKAGIVAGDRLVRVGDADVRTFGDVTRALHETSGGRSALPVRWHHQGEVKAGRLRLPKDWKEATPLVFSWRPSKWPLSPKPGFGGRPLTADEKRAHGIATDKFAFRVGYVVTWGKNAHTGHNARRAGIRKGDVIVSVAGKDDFRDLHHFHAWFRLTQKPDTTVPVVRIRGDRRDTLELKVLE